MRLVLMQFCSLDGVTQGPGSPDEDTSHGFSRGGWFAPYVDETFLPIVRRWAESADAYLFGRRTYTAFADAWPHMPDLDDPVAASLNGRPKHVVSSNLTDADLTWGPATLHQGDVEAAVAEITAAPGAEVQVHGSTTLGRALLRAGLVDELRLVVAPVIVGDGRRLLTEADSARGLRLLDLERTDAGLAVHTYAVEGPATFATYAPAER
ncbi:dihydrofolate reductase family protein [Actinomarinicola tropica]|uniref:Dihydrofolate reductase n=1 Tax=Actinomarinicola tropica TaxID=2789776 RepID=A0A5Q2REW9_9ACTN|nr:dihydrofolate reductase family protein [Actinomarinicola tropica]QGG94223.1 dihydrofolate reductase [Actinomarinicola tropica]